MIATALLVGTGVTLAHGAAHFIVGTPDSFDEAGVNAAGITVFFAATTAAWILLSLTGGT